MLGTQEKNSLITVSRILGCTVEVMKCSEIRIFKVIDKRWVLERSFSWLDKCRRLWKNYERYLHTSLQIDHATGLFCLVRQKTLSRF